MGKLRNEGNEENGKNGNRDALLYFVKNTGKAVIDLVQNVVPQLKKFDENMQTIGTEADKINQGKSNSKIKKKNITKKTKIMETMKSPTS